jgi:hypothetical protein
MDGRELSVKATLENPEEIRQSRSDSTVFVFYKAEQTRRWGLCRCEAYRR